MLEGGICTKMSRTSVSCVASSDSVPRAAAVATDQKAYAPAPWRCASREAEIGRWNVALEQEKVVSAQEIPHERNALQEPETDASVVEEETLRGSMSGQEQARDVSAQEIQHEVAASDA